MSNFPQLKAIEKAKVEELISTWKAVDKKKPKKEDIAKFKELLNIHGDMWRVIIDLADMTKQEIFEQMNISQLSVKMSLEQGYQQVRNELGYQGASMLEKILIEQIALAWLRHNWTELKSQRVKSGSLTIEQGKYWEQVLSASQRRLLRAVESLAKVRKLAARTPEILQVNIGQNQTNIAGK